MKWRVFALLVVTFAFDAHADVIPRGYRHYSYDVTFENLEAFPDWVFYVYPTSQRGRATVVGSGLFPGSFSLWPADGPKGIEGSSLWAMKKEDFAKLQTEEAPLRDGKSLRVFSLPDGGVTAVKSNEKVGPPRSTAPDSAWAAQLSRVYRIEGVGADVALRLTRNEIRNKDGASKIVPLGDELKAFEEPPKELAPKRRQGCL